MPRHVSAPLWALATATLWAMAGLALAAGPIPPRLQASEDGAYVVDPRAKLWWPRCVEGMTWNGSTCTGQPQVMDHAQASALALARWKADGVRWRLPHTTELQRLVDKTRAPQGLDPALFPAAPLGWHWSGTAAVRTGGGAVNPYNYDNIAHGRTAETVNQTAFLHGWAVHLGNGEASGNVNKRTALPVRLVRPAP